MKTVKEALRQIIFIAPIIWILELFQNYIYYLIMGKWGWIYPASPYHWFSFASLGNWCTSVLIMFSLYRFWLVPKGMHIFIRFIIVAAVGLLGEWLTGYLNFTITGEYLFLWEDSALRFIGPAAIPMWLFNALIYHALQYMLNRPHREQ